MTRLMHLATTALIFALVAAASLMALNKWHYDSLGFYVDQEGTIPADLGNYPTGITRYAYVNHRAPTAPCIDADTEEPILHSVVASSSLHSSPNKFSWGNPFWSAWNYPCNSSISRVHTATVSTEFDFGVHYFKTGYTATSGSSGTWISPAISVNLTRAGVADVSCYDFKVLNQKELKTGDTATAAFTVVNHGEVSLAVDSVAVLYMADDLAMVQNVSPVASFNLQAVPGGSLGIPHLASFQLPYFQGDRYFALSFGANAISHQWSQVHKITKKADLKFYDGGINWISPINGSPTEVSPDEVVSFSVKYLNSGKADSASETGIQVQVRGASNEYVSIPGAFIPIGTVTAKSGKIESDPVYILLTGEQFGVDDSGEKRSLRLKFVSGGTESGYNNNKSKYKKVIVADPEIFILGPLSVLAGGDDGEYSIDLGFSWESVASVVWSLPRAEDWSKALLSDGGVQSAKWYFLEEEDSVSVTAFLGWALESVLLKLDVETVSGEVHTNGLIISITPLNSVELVYNTFITCDAFHTGSGVSGKGDDRGFGAKNGSTRTHQVAWMDPLDPNPVVPVNQRFPSQVYLSSDVDQGLALPCSHICSGHVAAGAVPICDELGGGSVSSEYEYDSSSSGVSMSQTFTVAAFAGCSMGLLPAIDAECRVYLAQEYDDSIGLPATIPKPLMWRTEMKYDGFPHHELYVNDFLVKVHNPCASFEGITSLVPPMEYSRTWPDPTDPGVWVPVPMPTP